MRRDDYSLWRRAAALLMVLVTLAACNMPSPTATPEATAEATEEPTTSETESVPTPAGDDEEPTAAAEVSPGESLQPPMSGPFAPPPEGPPTLIFHNGVVVTMDADVPGAQAVAIVDDRIMAVGSDEDILALAGPDTVTVDLQGHALLPGFVDAHTHIFNDAGRIETDLAGGQQLELERGVTTLADMFTLPDFLAQMQEFESSGALRIRTSLYLTAVDNCGGYTGDWWREVPQTDVPGERLRIGGIKLFADGGSCGGIAFSYDHPFWGYGDLWRTQEEMDALVADIDAAGYQVAIHGLGDRAIEQILNTYENLLGGEPNTRRHRIEHNSTLRPDMIPRYSEIGVVPLIFGGYPACDPLGSPPPEAYQSWEWPWRALLDANPGLIVAWHSDTPWISPISPLQNLYSMTTSYEVYRDGVTVCDTPDWLRDQRALTVEEALPMMTINAAYALFREDEVGSITPGKFADVIVLSASPLDVAPEEIIDIEVWMTMIGGEVVYCMPGHEDVCT
jgi:predicted amidohydrolase YtcJ